MPDNDRGSNEHRRGDRRGALKRPAPAPARARRFVEVLLLALLMAEALAHPASAQSENPVYIDDSHAAWETFLRAVEQSENNAGESLRLFQELLDESGHALVPTTGAKHLGAQRQADQFVTVRQRVLTELAGDADLLHRYQLLQEAEAGRLLQSGRLLEVAMTRSLTDAGLQALLQLAQLQLEGGHFRVALTWLSEAAAHPNLAPSRSEAAHVWFMTALARAYLNENEAADAAIDSLRDLGEAGERHLLAITALREQITTADPPAVTVHSQPRTENLGDIVSQAIWSVPLENSLLLRLPDSGQSDDPHFQQLRQNGNFLAAAATIWDDLVFINEGHVIRALSRLTGAEVWRFADAPRVSAGERETDPALDMNVISVADGSLVTFTGHATSDRRSTSGRVVCLDARTGALRWMQSIARIDGAFDQEDLFPYGAPIVSEGSVFFLARRSSRQNLTSCYLIAMDLAGGDLRWTRHVSSAGGIRRGGRGVSTPVLHDGDLYIATSVGAVARVNGATGQTRWLRRFPVSMTPSQRDQFRLPCEITSPIVTEHRVIALEPDYRRLVLLDRETGDVVESFPAVGRDRYNAPAYLLGNERFLFAISDEIRAFAQESPGSLLWQLPAPAQSIGVPPADRSAPPPTAPAQLQIRGRVQLTDDWLIVPTVGAVLVVDCETGLVEHRVETSIVGNPTVEGSQLLLAGADQLEAYMSFTRAEQMLRGRMVKTPADPAAAISLMRMGMVVDDPQLVLEAARTAAAACATMPDEALAAASRHELFAQLSEVSASHMTRSVEEGRELHELIGKLAQTPQQRVSHLLMLAEWLQHHDVPRSVATYQALLGDANLASVEVPPIPSPASAASASAGSADIVAPAMFHAVEQLQRLIGAHGRSVYEPFERTARKQLTSAIGAGAGQPDGRRQAEELLRVAMSYPSSAAAGEASMRAAELFAREGRTNQALAALSWRYHSALPGSDRKLLLGAMADVAERGGWLSTAAWTLRIAAAGIGRPPHTGQLQAVTVGGIDRPVDPWMASLKRALRGQERAVIGALPAGQRSLGELGFVVPDWLKSPAPAAAGRSQVEGALPNEEGGDVLLWDGAGTLRFVRIEPWKPAPPNADEADAAAGFGSGDEQVATEIWRLALEARDVRILGAGNLGSRHEHHALLWCDEQTPGPFALLVDMHSGSVVWRTPAMLDILGDVDVNPNGFPPPQNSGRLNAQRRSAGGGGGFGGGGSAEGPVAGGATVGLGPLSALHHADRLILVHSGGAVAAVSMADGRSVLWRAAAPLQDVRAALATDAGIVLAGAGAASQSRIVCIGVEDGQIRGLFAPLGGVGDEIALGGPLDAPARGGARTGAGHLSAQHQAQRHDQSITWLCPAAFGCVLYATAQEIGLIDVPAGRRRWVNGSYTARESTGAWSRGEIAVVMDRLGDLRRIDLFTGELAEPYTPPRSEERPPMRVVDVEVTADRIIALYDQRIVVYHPTGRVIGCDVVNDEREYQAFVRTRDGLVVLSRFEMRAAPFSDQLGRRTEWVYRVYVMSENCKLLGDATEVVVNQRFHRMDAIDGHLLLSTPTHTVAVWAPVAGEL